MVYLVQQGYSYWITLAAAILLDRIFIFYHDSCHGSFFASHRGKIILGYISGILIFTRLMNGGVRTLRITPTAEDLDRRGTGDVWTMNEGL